MQRLSDARQSVQSLQQELAVAGESDAARRLEEALKDFYTTSTEALIGIVQALADTKASWMRTLDGRRQQEVQDLEISVREMMKLG